MTNDNHDNIIGAVALERRALSVKLLSALSNHTHEEIIAILLDWIPVPTMKLMVPHYQKLKDNGG